MQKSFIMDVLLCFKDAYGNYGSQEVFINKQYLPVLFNWHYSSNLHVFYKQPFYKHHQAES